MRHMPRPNRRVEETAAYREMKKTLAEYDATEAKLRDLRTKLQADVVEAVRAGLSKAEAARQVGYSREYVSRLVTIANERDGWTPPNADL